MDQDLEIPTVDISAFTYGRSLAVREHTARELARCCRPHGCVGITGHGVPSSLLAESFATAKKLFDLPLEDKMKEILVNSLTSEKGYSAVARERTVDEGTTMETDHLVGIENPEEITDNKNNYEIEGENNTEKYNVWPPESVLPGFSTFTTQLFWRLNETSGAILDALMMSLGLSEQQAAVIRKLHPGHTNQLRLLHYPSLPTDMSKSEGLTRLGEHTDVSTFTLLFQSDRGGLEIYNRETGKYMPATPKNGMLYLTIGDIFMRLSNGFYPAATHRVIIPDSPTQQGDETRPARYSMPYFVYPDADALAPPQPVRIIAEQKALYEPATFRSFSEQVF